MIQTLIVLSVSAALFASGRVRSDLVAVCALIALLLMGVLTPEEALSGFSNPVVIMMVGLFVVGGGVFQTGLAKMIGSRMTAIAGDSETRLFVIVMLVTAFIGAFVSNTGTVALMMPIVVSIASKSGINAGRMLMPLAFAGSMGGMLTLIGTPPNLVIQDVLTEAGYAPLSFFSFTPIGVVCIAVGILVMLPLSRWFLSVSKNRRGRRQRGKTIGQLVREYRLDDNLSRCVVTAGSSAVGQTLAALDIHNRFGLTVLEIRHGTDRHTPLMKRSAQKTVTPTTELSDGDVICLSGRRDDVRRLAAEYSLKLLSGSSGRNRNGTLAFYDVGIAEIVLMPNSRLVNRAVRDSGFREKYSVNVVGIRRSGRYIMTSLADEKMKSGDVLLVQGTWPNIVRLGNEEEHWVVLGQPQDEASRVTLDYKAPIAAVIMVAMVVTMVVDSIPVAPVTAVMAAGVLMVVTGCLRNVEAAYKTINWESIVLIAAMMPLSVALEKTGISALISRSLVGSLGVIGPTALLAGVYFTTSLLTMFVSNTATAVLMSPIALSAAVGIGVSPYPFLFAVTLGASMCFASPFSTPPNALVMQAGQYSFSDYIKVGLPLQVIIGVVMVAVLPLLFPF